MPSKYATKTYAEESIYHVYNRGVEKRRLFLDDQDYRTFVYNLKRYLDPDFRLKKQDPRTGLDVSFIPEQLIGKVSLLTFCLMPNHFHLMLKLNDKFGMSNLVKNVCTNYTSYFNGKYERTGKLCGGVYKAVRVITEEQCLQLSRYIHLNPLKLGNGINIGDYEHSGYHYISNNIKPKWLQWEAILLGRSVEQYKRFVESKFQLSKEDSDYLTNLVIEEKEG